MIAAPPIIGSGQLAPPRALIGIKVTVAHRDTAAPQYF